MKALDKDGLDYVVDKIYDLINSGGSADYIVEQGQNGIWTYRKWASGVAECWGTYTASKAGTSTTMLGLSGAVYETGSIAFPFTFIETPSATFGGNVGGQNTVIAYGRASTTDCACEMVSATGTRTMNVSIQVNGLWKTFTPSISYSEANLDTFFLHELGDRTLTVDTELGCGYIVVAPSGSWANLYFVNNYQGTCFAKTLVQGGSSTTISTSGSRFTLTTTGTNIEYYAIKILG